MKKNIYELTRKEEKEFKKEFHSTPLGKSLYTVKCCAYACIILVAIPYLMRISSSLAGNNVNLTVDFWTAFWFIYAGVMEQFEKYMFYRWLKIKHNVEY